MTILSELDASFEVDQALPTYSVLVRFLEQAESKDAAVAQVVARLCARGEQFEEVTAAPDPVQGRWVVTARFVVVSLEPHTAVAGVHESLLHDGVAFEEVWADARCA